MNGIDVSQWQGLIDFEAVAKAGIDIVYVKATQGTAFVDPYLYRNYREAQSAGLLTGFYHYLTAQNPRMARQEAYHFVTTIEGLFSDARLVMDLEDIRGMNREQVNEVALTFLQSVERYSNRSVAVYADAFNASRVLDRSLAVYPLWIAQYDVRFPNLNNPWGTWAGWQYTSQGRVPGISGNVDRSIFRREILQAESRITLFYTEKFQNTLTD